ncbi:MAG: hypothetical protein DRI86_02600 [Bacteroidetes bacterium]|nr:MAG: hypothetical protein DRI86_02600 [Bacteroidota bacterium]
MHNDKICIFVHTTRAALHEESGRKLRKELPFSKEDSPIIFNYLSEKKDKRIAYVHLIGIKSQKGIAN